MAEEKKTLPKTFKKIVFDGCIDGISKLPEAARIEVMQGLINVFMDGLICDDKQPLAIIPAADDPSYRTLVKVKDVEAIMTLRNSVGKQVH